MDLLPHSIDRYGQRTLWPIEGETKFDQAILREQLNGLRAEHKESKLRAEMWKTRAFYSALALAVMGALTTMLMLIFFEVATIPIAAGFFSFITALAVGISKRCWKIGNAHSSDAMGIFNEINRKYSFLTPTVNPNNGDSTRLGDLHRDIPSAFDDSPSNRASEK